MKSLFSRLKNILLRQIILIFVIGFVFFSFQIFNYSHEMLLAQAYTVTTPEGTYYKGAPNNNPPIRNEQRVKNAQKNLQETADNIRENLNIDQPIPEATKDFLDTAQQQVEETLEPITGTPHGYYQEHRPEVNNR
ncbi:hypothetical protein [Umezakia ovalisporum]|uniref:Uncharacterized protein n=1 Tax=Umezakia ovalisporum FSS-62 TaxID=2971776 RepID=A0AA43KFR0_9CYAN|nr:hypothetical protein [Umezakia ovalisporum]MDH6064228.1 hypothetical protein [Umezakia ovalisporum FSS-62]